MEPDFLLKHKKTCSRPKTNCLSVLLSLRFHQFTCLTLSLPGFPVGERHWGEEIRSQRGKCGSGWNLSACAFITTRHCCQRNLLPCLLSTRLSISTSSSQPKKFICNLCNIYVLSHNQINSESLEETQVRQLMPPYTPKVQIFGKFQMFGIFLVFLKIL